jgi:hypothetical protein
MVVRCRVMLSMLCIFVIISTWQYWYTLTVVTACARLLLMNYFDDEIGIMAVRREVTRFLREPQPQGTTAQQSSRELVTTNGAAISNGGERSSTTMVNGVPTPSPALDRHITMQRTVILIHYCGQWDDY